MAETMIPTWTVADRIRKAREVAGLDQVELAERLYVARSTVSTWENSSTTVPHRLKIERIAQVCGVSASWLLTGSADISPVDREYWEGNAELVAA